MRIGKLKLAQVIFSGLALAGTKDSSPTSSPSEAIR